MGRRRWNKKNPEKARAQQQPPRPESAGDPPVRLLALQPGSDVVAVGIGSRVTIVDAKTAVEVKLVPPPPPAPANAAQAPPAAASASPDAASLHAGCLRVLQFSPDGRSLLTGGDDKFVRLWLAAPPPGTEGAEGAAATWRCAAVWRTPKKMSAGGFSPDSVFALFADKFGDVLVGKVPQVASDQQQQQQPAPQVPSTLLGHFCSIVTGLAFSPCEQYLATSDKDYKVRLSKLPQELEQLSYEIQSYCLGHQDFVSSIAFAVQRQPGQQQEANDSAGSGAPSTAAAVLISGSGDGTVRMWDYVSGRQLASYVASAAAASAAAEAAEGGSLAAEAGGSAEAAAAGAGAGASEEVPSGGADEGGEEAASGGGDEGDDEEEEEGEGAEEGQGAGEGAGGQEGGGDGPGGGDGEEPQRRRKAPPCAPVLSLAVSEDGSTVAVVVEGDDEVQLLSVDWADRGLRLRQRLRWPDVRYPCQVAFGPGGRLWVVGGVPLPTARSVHLGVAKQDSDGQFVPCTAEVLSPAVRSLLEARVEEEEAKMAEGGELFVYSRHLRKPEYDEAEALSRKRARNDFKETQRLAALRQRQDEKAKQGQGQQGQKKKQDGQGQEQQEQGKQEEEMAGEAEGAQPMQEAA